MNDPGLDKPIQNNADDVEDQQEEEDDPDGVDDDSAFIEPK